MVLVQRLRFTFQSDRVSLVQPIVFINWSWHKALGFQSYVSVACPVCGRVGILG